MRFGTKVPVPKSEKYLKILKLATYILNTHLNQRINEVAMSDPAKEILAIIQTKPQGATNDELVQLMPLQTPAQRLEALNKLLKDGAIKIMKKGDTLVYQIKETTDTNLPAGTDNEEKIIYRIIEAVGNKGIWIRDIRNQSNLNMTQMNKILKNLETKRLIKAVKSVNASKKKVYMLYNLEPDRSITGGAWYQDQDFESEFVDVLNQQCLRFLQKKREDAEQADQGPLVTKQLSSCTVQEVHKYISDLRISKVTLDAEDLETILKTVVYDGNAERTLMPDGNYVYRAINWPLAPPGLVQMPCGVCPVVKNCADYGDVTPIKCQYMKEWLE